jgi:hypothetical protein
MVTIGKLPPKPLQISRNYLSFQSGTIDLEIDIPEAGPVSLFSRIEQIVDRRQQVENWLTQK